MKTAYDLAVENTSPVAKREAKLRGLKLPIFTRYGWTTVREVRIEDKVHYEILAYDDLDGLIVEYHLWFHNVDIYSEPEGALRVLFDEDADELNIKVTGWFMSVI